MPKTAARAKQSRNVSQISAVIDQLQRVTEAMNLPAFEEALRAKDGEILKLKEKSENLESEIKCLKSRVRDFASDVDDLVRVRKAIQSGHASDAVFHVERVLAGADSAWRTRA